MPKQYVRWTAEEETKVAMRAQEVIENPELSGNRLASGQRCKSLASAYGIAQLVLEPARRKSTGAFQQATSTGKLAANHKAILTHWKREQDLAREESERKAKEVERERQARTPPVLLDPLAPLKLMLAEVLTQAVAEGIMRAAAALEIPLGAGALAARSNGGNGSGAHSAEHAGVAAVVQALAGRTHRTPVDVVGLKGGQCTVVEKSAIAQAFDIRFIPADSHMRNRDVRDEVVICSKFVNHHNINRYVAGNARVHYANGGPQSVIQQLETIVREGRPAPH